MDKWTLTTKMCMLYWFEGNFDVFKGSVLKTLNPDPCASDYTWLEDCFWVYNIFFACVRFSHWDFLSFHSAKSSLIWYSWKKVTEINSVFMKKNYRNYEEVSRFYLFKVQSCLNIRFMIFGKNLCYWKWYNSAEVEASILFMWICL